MRPNTPAFEQRQTEIKFRKLLYKFFTARGNPELRHELVRKMRQLREHTCVVWEQFVNWYRSTFAAFSVGEHQRAVARVWPIYEDEHSRQVFWQLRDREKRTLH